MAKNNIPRHIGFIPDGNRRWGVDNGLVKEAGYAHGINPGLLLFEKCKECGIKETSIYCFTQDNTKRPSIQKQAFSEAPPSHPAPATPAAFRDTPQTSTSDAGRPRCGFPALPSRSPCAH